MKMSLEWLSYRPWCIKINFQKILVFPMDFNAFIHFFSMDLNEFIRGLDGFDVILASF